MAEKNHGFHEEFELSTHTLAIIPMQYGSKLYSKVLEMDKELISPFRPVDVIKKSCRNYASSFTGRKEGTKALIGVTHKSPIVIDPLQSIYFFPTTSPTNPDCAWIAHENVLSYKKVDKTHTEVIFRNKQIFKFSISYSSFQNQMLRTALLRTKMMQRVTDYDPYGRLAYIQWETEAMERRKQYQLFLANQMITQKND